MTPLGQYYIRQAGGGRGRGGNEGDIGPVYGLPPSVQRGHGIGSFWPVYFERFVLYSGVEPNLSDERLSENWDARHYAQEGGL